jgi:hypothetical protein
MAKRSPLDILVNSSILIQEPNATALLNGRYIEDGEGPRYLVKAYLQRSEGDGTDDGELPSFGNRASSGGGSTSTWLFRGYGIEYTEVPSTFNHGDNEDGYTYQSILTSSDAPAIKIPIYPNLKVSLRHGTLPIIHKSEVVMIGGKYQGLGPDKTIYVELRGIPIVLRGSMVR